MPKVEHPCLSCSLPDCDEGNDRCGLRRALRKYYWHIRRKVPVPPEVRARKNIAYNELHGDLHRARSKEQKMRLKEAQEAENA